MSWLPTLRSTETDVGLGGGGFGVGFPGASQAFSVPFCNQSRWDGSKRKRRSKSNQFSKLRAAERNKSWAVLGRRSTSMVSLSLSLSHFDKAKYRVIFVVLRFA